MEAPANIPPIIEATPKPVPARVTAPMALLALAAVGMAVAIFTDRFKIALPQCTFKQLTGLPCAFCGSTRALRALGHLHFAQAFWFNPLATAGVFGAVIAVICSSVAPQWFENFVIRVKRWPLLTIGLALVVANWLFVLKFLPR
jgi:hypothetical protein